MDSDFELNKDVAGEFRFKLVATNGQTIAVSQGYNSKESALKGIESVKQNAPGATIEDTTLCNPALDEDGPRCAPGQAGDVPVSGSTRLSPTSRYDSIFTTLSIQKKKLARP